MIKPLHHQFIRLVCRKGGSISHVDGDRIYQYESLNESIYGTAVELGSNMHFLSSDLTVTEKLQLNFEVHQGVALYFVYCTEGSLSYMVDNDTDTNKEIVSLETVIIGTGVKDVQIEIPKEQKTGFAIIVIDRDEALEALRETPDFDLVQAVFRHFQNFGKVNDFIHRCTFNLPIKSYINKIEKIEHRGIIRRLMINGIVHCVLALEIKNFQGDINNEFILQGTLSQKEYLRVQDALTDIASHPGFNYSVRFLCDKYYLSPQKLQSGFKTLTGKTVANYVLDTRLILSEKLIKENELTISEIVYKIGFSSRSYFSKIFKTKYGCSPRYYAKNSAESLVDK